MPKILEVIFVRSGCAFILGCIGSLIGLVAWAASAAQTDYPRSPSSIVWAAVGATFGFILGASIGYRRLAGRPSWLVSGLVGGILLGALLGWSWGHIEYRIARSALLSAGLSPIFIDTSPVGLTASRYETIGLQYGICLGILAGGAAGWFWHHPLRLNLIANLFPVVTSCFVALGAITMNIGFRDLSKELTANARQSWEGRQTSEVAEHRHSN
jgi:hypothetical protein